MDFPDQKTNATDCYQRRNLGKFNFFFLEGEGQNKIILLT